MKERKPSGYWTKEKCKEEALKYITRKDWKAFSNGSYVAARKYKILMECSLHMKETLKPSGYWTLDRCKEEALKYKTRMDWKCNNASSYQCASEKGFLGHCCVHMVYSRNHAGYWTKERCQEEAKKYFSRSEFRSKSSMCVKVASKFKWLDEICSHMIMSRKLTFEKCKNRALKYSHRSEFYKKSCYTYRKAKKNDWLKAICSHMESLGNTHRRLVYVYEFEDKSVYVGLTCNEHNRKYGHLTHEKSREKSSVYRHIKKTNLQPIYKKISAYVSAADAQTLENITVNKYKENGWNILNRTKTGALGSACRKWTKDSCKDASSKCKTLTEFYKTYRSAYHKSLKEGFINEICGHMVKTKPNKPSKYWTKNKIISDSKKYANMTDYFKNVPEAYKAAKRNKWIKKLEETI